MTVTYTDWLKSLPATRIKEDRVQQRRAQAEVAESLKTVLTHPGWLVYAQHLQALIDDGSATMDRLQGDMIRGTTLGQDLERQKLALRELLAARHAYQTALALIPEVIRQVEHLSQEEESQGDRRGQTDLADIPLSIQ